MEAAFPVLVKLEVELVAITRFWIAGLDWESLLVLHLWCADINEELPITPERN